MCSWFFKVPCEVGVKDGVATEAKAWDLKFSTRISSRQRIERIPEGEIGWQATWPWLRTISCTKGQVEMTCESRNAFASFSESLSSHQDALQLGPTGVRTERPPELAYAAQL